MMPTIIDKLPKKFRYPWVTIFTLLTGIVIATFWSIYTGEDIHIGVGAEIILLSWGSLLINRDLSVLAKSMLALGLLMPFLAASLTALYYPEANNWVLFGRFWALFGLGIIPGLTIFFLGVFLFTELDKKGKSLVRWQDPAWIVLIDLIFRLGALTILATLFIGYWNPYTQWMVYGGTGIFLTCLIILIPYRFTAGLRGAGKVMISLGIGGMLIVGLAFWIAQGKVSLQEAFIGLIPTFFSCVLGFVILFSTKPRAFRKGE